jgi:dTDP-glucose 4,6-dehydratase
VTGASKKIMVTGGSGFIGSAFCRHCVLELGWAVVNLDSLTYAAADGTLGAIEKDKAYDFVRGSIADSELVQKSLDAHRPDAIVNFAAESHVDRSIDGPMAFVHTNVVGTAVLLEAARRYRDSINGDLRDSFRFHHVSTDEVYGSLDIDDAKFAETTGYDPTSPYSASKAASDHLVRAWGSTFGLPVTITNCSNNYGPFHFPEKLIPLMIIKAMRGEKLPVYGSGGNVRDWLYVDDHVRAIALVLQSGKRGETYNVGANEERTNLAVVERICDLLDQRRPRADEEPRRALIDFVTDRPGHDLRYAIDNSKICSELGWRPSVSFDDGLAKTVDWYLDNEWWWRPLTERRYGGERLGI